MIDLVRSARLRRAGGLTLAVTLAFAASLPAAPASSEAWHVIRPGDTLEGLAARYLGDAKLWPEIHRLNPELIADPHWIFPGRRIRVRVERPSAQANAEVLQVSRRVEARPAPVAWREAGTGDLLIERDGIRTYEKSSAHLLFDDGTAATLGENSLVFIRRQTPARAAKPRKEIEIERGQADLTRQPTAGMNSPEIEVIVASARTKALAEADGSLRMRSRQSDEAAQFMVYGGKASVSAGGRAVDLPAGTGSVVPPRAAPSPAEPLLPAPRLLDPSSGGELGRDDPQVAWSAVAGAASYVVELCRDADCGALIERAAGLAGPAVRLAGEIAVGPAFLRVTAVAPSGLDGFPSAPAPVAIVESVRPPAPVLVLLDGTGQPLGRGLCLSAPPRVQVRALDGRGQPIEWELNVDGRPARRDAIEELTATGRHEIAVTAVDARGRRASSPLASFDLDLAPPQITLPPQTGQPALPPAAAPPSRWRRWRRPPTPRAVDPCGTGLEVAVGQGPWRPVACTPATDAELPLAGDRAAIRLRAAGAPLRLGELLDLPAGGEVALEIADLGCGLAGATLRIVPSPHRRAAGRALVELEVSDLAGHASRAAWHLGAGARP